MKHSVAEVYGIQAIQQLIQRDVSQILELFYVPAAHEARNALLAMAREQGVSVQSIRKPKLDQMTHGGVHQGVLARIRVNNLFGPTELKEALGAHFLKPDDQVPLFLMLEGITDPHNFGACLRSAEAAGVTGVIVPRRHSAPMTSVVRKVACGAAETVPIYQVGHFVDLLKEADILGYQSVAMVANESARSLYQVDFTQPSLVVLGAEGPGLKPRTQQHCTVAATIPMSATMASLNVSVATGVALFEVVRQFETVRQRR